MTGLRGGLVTGSCDSCANGTYSWLCVSWVACDEAACKCVMFSFYLSIDLFLFLFQDSVRCKQDWGDETDSARC